MRILYHHRTRATDAQRVHIVEMIRAFRALGHEVREAAVVSAEAAPADVRRDAAEAPWKRALRKAPFASEVVQLGYNPAGFLLLAWGMLRRPPEMIYERYSLFNFSGVLAARLFGRPIILEVNSPLALEQHREGEIRSLAFARWTERRIANLATRVVTVSGPLRRLLIEEGVDPARIAVLPNGVDPGRFRGCAGDPDRRASLRKRLGLGDRTVVGFVGWFRRWHGLDLLLAAFRDSDLLRRRAAAVLVGDGPVGDELRRFRAEAGLADSVFFTGPLPHAEIPAHVDLFDIAVQPFANEYCCPMKILEYMGMGKPVVAPAQENIRELVRDGVDGLLFTPGEGESMSRALAQLVEDEELRRRLGEQARRAITERGFLWTENARRAVELGRRAAERQ